MCMRGRLTGKNGGVVLSARHLHYLRLAEVKNFLRCLLSRGEVVSKAQLPTASRPRNQAIDGRRATWDSDSVL